MVRRTKLIGRDWPSVVAAVLTLCVVTGCGSLGPGSVSRDQFDHISALSESGQKVQPPILTIRAN